MKHQNIVLYAAIHAPEFPAQSIMRMRTDLGLQPLAILDGNPPLERVCSVNLSARNLGVAKGMTRIETEAFNSLCSLKRSPDTESASRIALLDSISKFSPRIEEVHFAYACGFVLDISGSERLFGKPNIIARQLSSKIESAGFHASIAISHNFDTARICAQFLHGITIIPWKQEAGALANIPIASLRLEEHHAEIFSVWGIRKLGELAQLPEDELISRLGPQSKYWLSLSRGLHTHPMQPIETTFELKEHFEFETLIKQTDSLLFITANMIESLVSRAAGKALALATITVRMSLDEHKTYERIIRPAIPTQDSKFLLKLIQLELAAHPPSAAIASLTLTAEPGRQSKVQLELFVPQRPESSRLDVTLARLKALVGNDRVGSPTLKDSHRPADFDIEPFSISDNSYDSSNETAQISLRRLRPSHLLRVQFLRQQLCTFADGSVHYEVKTTYGPWRSSGSWWSDNQWDLDEWDVKAINSNGETIGCLIVHDRLSGKWTLEAFYD